MCFPLPFILLPLPLVVGRTDQGPRVPQAQADDEARPFVRRHEVDHCKEKKKGTHLIACFSLFKYMELKLS